MADSLQRGSLFLWKPPGKITRHLRLVATEPNGPTVVVVPIQTYRTGYDKSCLLNEKGKSKDINYLDWTSIPAYHFMRVYSPEELGRITRSKECRVLEEVASSSVINKVLTAACRNWKQLQPDVWEVLQAMGKASKTQTSSKKVDNRDRTAEGR